MKTIMILVCAGALLTLPSCQPLYYQVIELKSTDVSLKDNVFSYDNGDISIAYDFSKEEDGVMCFTLLNKTSQPIQILLDKSHIVINGESLDYYYLTERSVTSAGGVGYFQTVFGSRFISQESVSQTETRKMKSTINLPPYSTTQNTSVNVLLNPYPNCFLDLNDKWEARSYEAKGSPLKFRNYVTYKKANGDQEISIDNEFWVYSVQNVKRNDFFGRSVPGGPCAEPEIIYWTFPYKAPNKMHFTVKP